MSTVNITGAGVHLVSLSCISLFYCTFISRTHVSFTLFHRQCRFSASIRFLHFYLSAFRCIWFISTFIRDIVSYRHFSGMYIGLASLTAVVEYPGCLHDDVLFTSQVNGGYTQRSRQLHSLSFGHKWFICCHFILFNWIYCPVIITRCVPF